MTNLTKEIADNVTSLGIASAYGTPVEIDGSTIIPVALTSYGFGAGEGESEAGGGETEGSGGGGGGISIPVGAYITRQGVTRFEPNTIALLVVGIPFVCVAGRALARVVRALKR